MPYQINLIDANKKQLLYSELLKRPLLTRKANIYGCCVKLLTDSRLFVDVWTDNFYTADENMRSHGRLIAVEDPTKSAHLDYDPLTKTAFIYNFDYYGWIKSAALAIAGDILEDAHEIYSIHGAALDVMGSGVALIAPSGTGKTTHSWGLLRNPGVRLLSDDWFFARMYEKSCVAFGSEKNCYVDVDLGSIWSEYKNMLENSVFDKRGRAVVNARWGIGNDGVVPITTMKKVILMKRDPSDTAIIRELSKDEALGMLIGDYFFNPHQLVNDERKHKLRKTFFSKLLDMTTNYVANTAQDPVKVQGQIYRAVK